MYVEICGHNLHRLLVGLVAFALTAVTSCGNSAAHRPSSALGVSQLRAESQSSPLRAPDHVLVVVFENKSYGQIVESGEAPYLTSLARGSALFVNAYAETHPSQPNYIALLSGSTQGVEDDSCPVDLGDQPNLARQLLDSGYGFTGYSEGMPTPGYRGCSYGQYAAKHNPWADFSNIPAEASQPYYAFPGDLNQLPTVAFLIPDMCNDMHDCSVSTGDGWAADHLDSYARWATTHNSLLIVTFDEDDGSDDNHILTFVAGADVRPASYSQRIDHYSLLRSIEDWYGLSPLGEAANAEPLPDLGY